MCVCVYRVYVLYVYVCLACLIARIKNPHRANKCAPFCWLFRCRLACPSPSLSTSLALSLYVCVCVCIFFLLLLTRASLKWLPVPSHTSFMREFYAVCVCVCVWYGNGVVHAFCVCVCAAAYIMAHSSDPTATYVWQMHALNYAQLLAFLPLSLSLLLKAKGDEILQLNLFQQISANKMMKNPTVYPLAEFFIFLLSTLCCIVYFIFFPVHMFRCLLW